MKTPGEPVHGETYAFDFVTLEPRPDRPRMLLVLLHGVGGDETQLAGVGGRVDGDVLVVLPRGQRSISGGKLGWYRVGLSADGPQIVEEEAEEARLKLIDFIAHVQQRFDVPAERTVLAGFSQGGILAASAALTTPACTAGFAILCGRILPEIEPLLGPRDAIARLEALVLHGRSDETLPVQWAEQAQRLLEQLQVRHACRVHDAGHELTPAMEDDFIAWLEDGQRGWNTTGHGGDGRSGR